MDAPYNTKATAVLDLALEALRRQTGLAARVEKFEPPVRAAAAPTPYRPDALIAIQVHQRTYEFIAELKVIDRFEAVAQVHAFWPQHGRPPLILVAPYITAQTAERCRELRLFFLDTAGNAYIDLPGFYLYVTGRKRPAELAAFERGRIKNPAALKVIFAILCRPDLLGATYREIAAVARVALGTVGPVMKDLEARKHVATFGAVLAKRRLIDPERLLKEWVDFYPAALRPKLNPRRFRGPHPDWAEPADVRQYAAYWGGEMAAYRLTGYLKPEAAIIYTEQRAARLITDCRLRADANGDVQILDVFWNPDRIPHAPDLVPPILAYADLMTTTEGRDWEAARLVYDEYIAPNLHRHT